MIETALINLAKADTTVADLCGGRFYFSAAKLGTKAPFVMVQREASEYMTTLASVLRNVKASIMFLVVADQYAQARALADALRHVLAGFTGEASGWQIQSCFVASESDSYEPPLEGDHDGSHIVETTYQVSFVEPEPN